MIALSFLPVALLTMLALVVLLRIRALGPAVSQQERRQRLVLPMALLAGALFSLVAATVLQMVLLKRIAEGPTAGKDTARDSTGP